MNFDLKSLLRPHIRELKPYTSARDEYSGKDGVFLDANENPFGSITKENFNRYPDPYQQALKERIATIKNVSSSRIFLGNGSDEPIDLLFRAFCNPAQDNVIILPPTYGMYGVSASINAVETISIPLTEDFQLQNEKVLEVVSEKSKILFICSPNNPSGNSLNPDEIEELIQKFPGIVVIDEAYVDFMSGESFVKKLEDYPNLVVLQTFSKAWGLASLRLGMAFANEEIISILNKIKPPYNISGLTQKTVLEALDNIDKMKKMVADILTQREELKKELESLAGVIKVYPSDANFLLVKVPNANKAYQDLIDRKVILRNRSNVLLCENCLRITIGTKEENQILIAELKNWLSENS